MRFGVFSFLPMSSFLRPGVVVLRRVVRRDHFLHSCASPSFACSAELALSTGSLQWPSGKEIVGFHLDPGGGSKQNVVFELLPNNCRIGDFASIERNFYEYRNTLNLGVQTRDVAYSSPYLVFPLSLKHSAALE